MKKLFKEFKDFINKGNALALAIGVIIGGAFTGIVTAINNKIISPFIGWLIGGESLEESEALTTILSYQTDPDTGAILLDPDTGEAMIENAIYWGAFFQAVIDFILIAVILFVIFKVANSVHQAALRAHEVITEQFNKEEKVEEAVVVEETPVVEEKVEEVNVEVQLLTEIRDLLKKDN